MPEGGEYDRGVAAGQLLQRLDGHDEHLARINGSIGDSARAQEAAARALDRLAMQVQRLADAADADRAKAVALATGLKDADEARRNTETQRWAPLTRLGLVLGAIAAAIAIVAAIATHHL